MTTRSPRALLPTAFALAACFTFAGCSDDNNTSVGSTPPPDPAPFSHADHFAANPYVGPNMNQACIGCHAEDMQDVMKTGHWNWQGELTNVPALNGQVHGKIDALNNFCVAVQSNEARCTVCHIGVGWADNTFDLSDPGGVDCLICHDGSGLYAKQATAAGKPVPGIDWNEVAANISMPSRVNCGNCHYGAGGGDNVKHGDLYSVLNEPTREDDVHMGIDGGDFSCTNCHASDEQHGIGGMPFHSTEEGNMRTCTTCHDGMHEEGSVAALIVDSHGTLSCQACHVPSFARARKTKVEWYWAEAGDATRVPQDVGDGRFDYDRKKGVFVWKDHVRPVLRRFDGTWNKMYANANDTYTGDPSPANPVVLGEPATSKDPSLAGDAKLYPFKKMIGNQVADPVNKRIMVPHLFGTKAGPNPYWGTWDWDLALQDASAYTGQPYSGTFGFVDTVMYLTVNHEIAPKEQALGAGGCMDCHGNDGTGTPRLDWSEIGRPDPLAPGN